MDMTSEQPTKTMNLLKHVDTIWKVSVVLLLVLNLWADRRYVMREAYEHDLKETRTSTTQLEKLYQIVSLAIVQHQKTLDDHETRVRIIERIR